jgi:DNA (cytosine-5)-methyltransferase 1
MGVTRPLLLDLFCGAGGAAMGYHRAGFDVVGVDIKSQPNYPFDFVCGDVMHGFWDVLDIRGPFDAVHASPPCQAYSIATSDKSKHPDLIGPTRDLLTAADMPYILENVPGAPMPDALVLCGSSFGLRVRRHRLIETNWPLLVPPCIHGSQGQPVGVYGGGTGKSQKRGRKVMSSAEAIEVMEMPWADRAGATQAIPPAYTEFIGQRLLEHIKAAA